MSIKYEFFIEDLFIGYGISISSTDEGREKKIISYLEKNTIHNLKLLK